MLRSRHFLGLALSLSVVFRHPLACARASRPAPPASTQPSNTTPAPSASDERTSVELIAAVGSLSALICIMAVAIFWRRKDAASLGDAARQRQGYLRSSNELDYNSARSGDDAARQADTFAESLPRRPEGALKSVGSGFSSSSDLNCCQMCLARPRSILVLPCRHACLCVQCVKTVMTPAHGGDGLCIICRAPIQTYELGYFHRTYNPPLSFPDTLRPSDNAPCEQAAGVRGDRESSWLRTKQGQSASSVAVVKGQPGEAIEQLERKVLLYDEFEISSYTSSFAGASTSRCHGTASLATTDLVSLCSVRQQGLSCSQVSGGTVHGHAFTPRMYYESDTIYLSQSPRVFEEFQGLGLEMAAARRVCRLCCLHARCLQRVPATYSPTAASTHPRDCARPFLLFGSCSPAAHYPWYPPDTSSRLAASPDKGPGVLTWACARASGVTEASKSEKGMVSGAYRSWIEHGLTQSSRGDGHTRAETQHISGSGSTMGAVEIGAELFSLHGSFYA